jgi:hypothetical protein
MMDNVCVKGGAVEMIHGRTHEEVKNAMYRAAPALMRLRGVVAVMMDRHGLGVMVEPDHDLIPESLEGHPIHVMPARGSAVLLGADLAPRQ